MTKLSNKQVKVIVKWSSEDKASSVELARLYSVSVRRIQQLTKQYKETGVIPVLKKERRPKTYLTEEQKQFINQAWQDARVGARLLRYDIQAKFGVNIPHNKIHAYLKETNRSKPDAKKQKQRKYCRYQREHSLSLVHIDWHEIPNGTVLPVLDDASRKILAIGEFKTLSTNNAINVLKKAIQHANEHNSYIRELNADRDTTFMTNRPRDKKKHDNHRFQQFLRKHSIKFIPSRRNHPQTNGKNERWFQEYDKHRHRFNTPKDFADWYNNRLHGSLDLSTAENPNQAFIRKLQPQALLGLFYKNITGDQK